MTQEEDNQNLQNDSINIAETVAPVTDSSDSGEYLAARASRTPEAPRTQAEDISSNANDALLKTAVDIKLQDSDIVRPKLGRQTIKGKKRKTVNGKASGSSRRKLTKEEKDRIEAMVKEDSKKAKKIMALVVVGALVICALIIAIFK